MGKGACPVAQQKRRVKEDGAKSLNSSTAVCKRQQNLRLALPVPAPRCCALREPGRALPDTRPRAKGTAAKPKAGR